MWGRWHKSTQHASEGRLVLPSAGINIPSTSGCSSGARGTCYRTHGGWYHATIHLSKVPLDKFQESVKIQSQSLAQTVQNTATPSGFEKHSTMYASRHILSAQCAFKILMIHEVLRFALRIAFCCVLHQCQNLDIHCWNLWQYIDIIDHAFYPFPQTAAHEITHRLIPTNLSFDQTIARSENTWFA